MTVDSVGQEFRQVTMKRAVLALSCLRSSWEALNSCRWRRWLGVGGFTTLVSMIWAVMTHLGLSKGSPVCGLSGWLGLPYAWCWISRGGISKASIPREPTLPDLWWPTLRNQCHFHHTFVDWSSHSLLRFKHEKHWIRWTFHALPALKFHDSVNWHWSNEGIRERSEETDE